MEVGHSGVVARWNSLHGRNVQGQGEVDVREGCVVAGSEGVIQLEPGGECSAGSGYSGGEGGGRVRVQGPSAGGGCGQCGKSCEAGEQEQCQECGGEERG